VGAGVRRDDVDVALSDVTVERGIPGWCPKSVAGRVPDADEQAFMSAVEEGGDPRRRALHDRVRAAASAGAEGNLGLTDEMGPARADTKRRVTPDVDPVGVDGSGRWGL
jgi:hypothetical protein